MLRTLFDFIEILDYTTRPGFARVQCATLELATSKIISVSLYMLWMYT